MITGGCLPCTMIEVHGTCRLHRNSVVQTTTLVLDHIPRDTTFHFHHHLDAQPIYLHLTWHPFTCLGQKEHRSVRTSIQNLLDDGKWCHLRTLDSGATTVKPRPCTEYALRDTKHFFSGKYLYGKWSICQQWRILFILPPLGFLQMYLSVFILHFFISVTLLALSWVSIFIFEY